MAAQTAQMNASVRNELGSRANRRLRQSGMIPAVIYGHKEAVLPVTLAKREVVNHLEKGAHLFDLSLDGRSEKVLVKEVQYDHLGMEVLHVDFARVSLDEKVEVHVPLELRGEPKGEADGGVLQQSVATLHIECLVTDIPQYIRHNVAEMALDDVLHVKDLKLPPGVRVLQDEDLIVASVRTVQEAEPAEVTDAGPAEPEVIGKKDTDDAEAETEEKK